VSLRLLVGVPVGVPVAVSVAVAVSEGTLVLDGCGVKVCVAVERGVDEAATVSVAEGATVDRVVAVGAVGVEVGCAQNWKALATIFAACPLVTCAPGR
jgi:hypothetical protein